jgi:hypothetical protein
MNLIELQEKIHSQNVELGWWDKERPYHVFACLFHSELSEAMEGDRKGLMDDHLPKHPMFQVELADFVIRCLDWLGSMNWLDYDFLVVMRKSNSVEFIADMHHAVSTSYNLMNDPYYRNRDAPMRVIASAVVYCFDHAELKGFDLLKIILEKVEYNKHRADHKRENRDKEGGKKY